MRRWRYYEVRSPDGRLRYSTIFLSWATDFATWFYEQTTKKGSPGVICSISERIRESDK